MTLASLRVTEKAGVDDDDLRVPQRDSNHVGLEAKGETSI